MRKIRIYVDTSVIGGCFEWEFSKDSLRLFRYADIGKIHLLASNTVVEELERAPENVRKPYQSIHPEHLSLVPISQEILDLQRGYLRAKILTPSSSNDALHVAAATVSAADAIVSWNFKHIVQFGKMRAYNKINSERGYGFLNIVTPREVNDETT